jgi:hypothetical protein
LQDVDIQSHLSFGITPRMKVRLLDMHSIVKIWKQHENSKKDSHVNHVLYISYIYVEVVMFFVLIKRDTGLEFEKIDKFVCLFLKNRLE